MLAAVGKFAGPLAAAFAALQIGDLIGSTIRDGITQANDLDQTVSAIRTVFGGASGDIEQFAKDAVSGLGITEQQALEASQMFGVFGKAAGLTGTDLSGFSNELGGLGADLAAFYGGDVQTALDAISAGLRGESEPLRQYGVLLDDATLKARAMSEGIYDGTGPLTQQQRVLAAQAEILAQTTDAQGQAAREAGTFDGQLKRLTAGWESLVTAIGQLFLPIATEVVSFLNTNIMPAVSAFIEALKSGQGGGFGEFLQKIGAAFGPVFDAIAPLIPALVDLSMSLSPIVLLFRALEPALPTIMGLIAQLAGLIGGVLTQVLGVVVPPLVEIITLFTNALAPILPVIGDLLVAILVPAVQLLSAVIDAIMPIISGLLGILAGLLNFVIGVFTGDWDRAWAGVQQIFQGFVDTINGVINGTLKLLFEGIPQFIGSIFSGVGDWLKDAGIALIQGFIDGINGAIGFVGDALNGVMDFIGGFFPHSPAKRGPFSGSGWTGLKQSGGALYDQFVSGFQGPDPEMPGLPKLGTGVTFRRPDALDAVSGTGVAGARKVEQNNYFDHMDPEIGIEATKQSLASLAGRAGAK
ncbi:hypothetical protein NS183_07750 [Microbacterium testaceum]|nr:hypothetical protein NS183_07750 [Microbacterium testaceum]